MTDLAAAFLLREGRVGVSWIFWEVTDRCPQRCSFCFKEPGADELAAEAYAGERTGWCDDPHAWGRGETPPGGSPAMGAA